MLLIFSVITVFLLPDTKSQVLYDYDIDLTKATNNHLKCILHTPVISSDVIIFSFPKIIPGTYMISNFGNFISDLKAYDKLGHSLQTNKINSNQWQIRDAKAINMITYTIEGIFDTKRDPIVYPMAATSVEKDNIVINSPGFFGYFEGLNKIPFRVSIKKPVEYFASSSMTPVSSSSTRDIFQTKNLDELYDEPIMYCRPDTTTIQVGNCSVLFSVYSPGKIITSDKVASLMKPILTAVQNYLGGTLPANKYAFIFYFNTAPETHSFKGGIGGALEHLTSSFYYIQQPSSTKAPINYLAAYCTHEFFHIITPLTIASKQIKEFNFDTAVLSKHLWLYEGSTEYNAHYVQEKFGLINRKEFLKRLSDKITNSRSQYNDSLPFTELSKRSADIYNNQFGNVYQKGALISACLDIYLLNLSNGKYGMHDLTHDLGVRYGIYRPFDDENLFDEITQMTFPDIRNFFKTYIEGPTPINYDYFFGLAGIKYTPFASKQVLSFGAISCDLDDSTKQVSINSRSKFNDFSHQMGYHVGDIFESINSIPISTDNFISVRDSLLTNMKAGETLNVKVARKNKSGDIEHLSLSNKMQIVTAFDNNKLEFMEAPTEQQKMVQQAWLN